MQTHSYGPAASQVGDLHLPQAEHPPVVVLLHGGFWRLPYGYDQYTPIAEDLVRRGYAAWNLEYRRIGEPGGGWPNTLRDVSLGIEHLAKLKAGGADLDLSRVITVGHSAGGHLALWAGGPRKLAAGDPAPKVKVMAAVGQAPAADLKRIHELGCSNRVSLELTGGTPEQYPDRYHYGSPRALLPLGIPQLIVHGDEDDTVIEEIGREYAAAARKAGDKVEYVSFPGMGHFEHLDPTGHAWETVVVWLGKVLPKS